MTARRPIRHAELWPERLETIYMAVYSCADDVLDLPDEKLHQLAETMVLRIAEQFGNQSIYIPFGDRLRKEIRNRRLIGDSRVGMLPKDLANKYRLNVQDVYRILRVERNRRGVVSGNATLQARNQQIIADHKDGAGRAELSQKYNLCAKRIGQILNASGS